MNDDLVSDILQRIIERRIKLTAAQRRSIEEDVRRDWGGERHYIAKTGESAKQKLSERDQRIRDEHRRGEREQLLARRWGISVRRVRQIINAVKSVTDAVSHAAPASNDEPSEGEEAAA